MLIDGKNTSPSPKESELEYPLAPPLLDPGSNNTWLIGGEGQRLPTSALNVADVVLRWAVRGCQTTEPCVGQGQRQRVSGGGRELLQKRAG